MFSPLRALGRSLVGFGAASLVVGSAAFAAPVPADSAAGANDCALAATAEAPLCLLYLSGGVPVGPAPALLGLAAFSAPDASAPGSPVSFEDWLAVNVFGVFGDNSDDQGVTTDAAPFEASLRRILWTE